MDLSNKDQSKNMKQKVIATIHGPLNWGCGGDSDRKAQPSAKMRQIWNRGMDKTWQVITIIGQTTEDPQWPRDLNTEWARC